MEHRDRTEKRDPVHLELIGVPCPLNWARAKARLETMDVGERLEMVTDDPRAARDVPIAAESEGYAVIEVVESERLVRILIER